MEILIALIVLAVWTGISFVFATWIERKRWNKLIEEGIIPAPNKGKYNV